MQIEEIRALASAIMHKIRTASDHSISSKFADFIESLAERRRGAKYYRMAAECRAEIFPELNPDQREDFDLNDERGMSQFIGMTLREMRRGSYLKFLPIYATWSANKNPIGFKIFCREVLGDDFDNILSGAPYENKAIDVFICWTGSNALALARIFKEYIDGGFGGGVQSYLSDIDLGDGIWTEELRKALLDSAEGIAFVTQDCLDSDYLLHDIALLNSRFARSSIVLVDVPLNALPRALREYQALEYSAQNIERIVKKILGRKNIAFDRSYFTDLILDIEEVRQTWQRSYVTSSYERWEGLSRPLAFSDQNNSPYDLAQLLSVATSEIYLTAQNHWFMTASGVAGDRVFWPLVEGALLRGVSVEVLSMHEAVSPSGQSKSAPNSFELWSHYMNVPLENFRQHASDTWAVLRAWDSRVQNLKSAGADGLGEFRVYGAYFLPLTISYVDPKEDHGFLVLSPRMGHEASPTRPHFVIRKRQERQVFNYFWSTHLNGHGNVNLVPLAQLEA